MSDDVNPPIWSRPMHLARLQAQKPTPFALASDATVRAAIASRLGLSGLRKLRFEGELRAAGGTDWQLNAALGATVIQPCVLTLAPVTTRIDEAVERHYTGEAQISAPQNDIEIPEGEDHEVVGELIDPGLVMVEALALALPVYPRARDAKLARSSFTEPGKSPLSEPRRRPFAGLRALRDKLQNDDG
ncbi:MAG: DUF177 domain-containing protein [Paracoccaceae bacterium]